MGKCFITYHSKGACLESVSYVCIFALLGHFMHDPDVLIGCSEANAKIAKGISLRYGPSS